MYACVVLDDMGNRTYSSFWQTAEEAIEYAENHCGVIAVEKAHAKEAPVWTMTR